MMEGLKALLLQIVLFRCIQDQALESNFIFIFKHFCLDTFHIQPCISLRWHDRCKQWETDCMVSYGYCKVVFENVKKSSMCVLMYTSKLCIECH